MKQLLIGLGSKARIGKDYATAELAKIFNVERFAFADALKIDVAELLAKCGLNYWELEKIPEEKAKLRPLVVQYSETVKLYNPNVWIDRVFDVPQKADIRIITDVRYPPEIARLKAAGGIYIDIVTDVPPANELEAKYSPMLAAEADHLVKNNFDSNFVPMLVDIINDYIIWEKILSAE